MPLPTLMIRSYKSVRTRLIKHAAEAAISSIKSRPLHHGKHKNPRLIEDKPMTFLFALLLLTACTAKPAATNSAHILNLTKEEYEKQFPSLPKTHKPVEKSSYNWKDSWRIPCRLDQKSEKELQKATQALLRDLKKDNKFAGYLTCNDDPANIDHGRAFLSYQRAWHALIRAARLLEANMPIFFHTCTPASNVISRHFFYNQDRPAISIGLRRKIIENCNEEKYFAFLQRLLFQRISYHW